MTKFQITRYRSARSSLSVFPTMLKLKYKKAKDILSGVNFPGDSDPTYQLSLHRSERRFSLTHEDTLACQIAAAIEIQRVWRGYCARCKLGKLFHEKDVDSFSINEFECPHLYAKYQDWCQAQGFSSTSTATVSLQTFAALTIQSWWRKRAHFAHKSQKENELTGAGPGNSTRRGSTVITGGGVTGAAATGAIAGRRKSRRKKLTVHVAAVIIQRAWRRHNDMKVFEFYRELINFKGRGDPNLMLRSINPKEAQLLDRAAGAHVRFRLGGVRFPPNIYYKIFTHRPIVDLCACSPRDYTVMACRLQQARDRNNKKSRIPADNDQCGWYKRHENNGWRLVSDRFFLSPYQDTITIETSCEKQDFHHSKLQRRQDVMKKHKRKKIEWLRKMYRDGMIQAKEEVSVSQVQLVAEEVMTLVEQHQIDQVMEQDIDDLLGWTNALNFDEYVTEWYSTASSGFSDENHDIHPSQDDKYEVTVTLSNSKK